MLSYVTTLNLVRIGIKHKLKCIKIPKTKKSLSVLIVLLKYNIILGWSVYLKKNRTIYLVYFNKTKKNITTFIKPTKKLTIKYKFIKKIYWKFSSNTIFLLTSRGILSINDAFKKKTGGFLFFRII